MLPENQFREVVRLAPLVSIDMVVRNADGHVLLGLRKNEPARGTWFVPGGIVRKNESLDAAFTRISRNEIGSSSHRRDARFLGVFEHFYTSNYSGEAGFGTHYVVLAYELSCPETSREALLLQHKETRWFPVDELLDAAAVHANTKAYFRRADEHIEAIRT